MTLDSTYIYPDFDDAPTAFYCKNVLSIFASKQEKWLKVYNDKWSSELNYTLEVLQPNQLVVGFPATSNARALHCFAVDNPKQNLDWEENLVALGLVYCSGKTQLNSTAANQYGDFIATSFWLQVLNRFLLKVCKDNAKVLTQGWPDHNNYYNTDGDIEKNTPSKPANLILKTTRMNPDADINAALAGLGLRGYLEIQLTVTPYEIPQPNFS